MQFIWIHWGTCGCKCSNRTYIYIYRCNAIIESIELRKIRSRECSDKLARGCELDDSRIDGGYPLDCEFWISIVCASFSFSGFEQIFLNISSFLFFFFSPPLLFFRIAWLLNFAWKILYRAYLAFRFFLCSVEMIKSRGEKIFILFLFFIVIEIFLAKRYLAKTFFSTNTRKDSLISSWLARISSGYHWKCSCKFSYTLFYLSRLSNPS